jgi:hypothetical protein
MLIERRSADRKTTDVNIEFHCCEKGCKGKADDISPKGMFIRTRDLCFPVNSPFDIFYSTSEKTFRIPVTLSRLVRDKNKSGIGISFIRAD